MKIIIVLYFIHALFAATTDKDFEKWEKILLKEVSVYEQKDPKKVYWIYLAAARELTLFHYDQKASKYFEKSLEINPSSLDKTEIYVQLVNLNRENKKKIQNYLVALEKWWVEHPQESNPGLQDWLKLMKGYSQGKTPFKETPGYFKTWAKEERVKELVGEKKIGEAFGLLSPYGLEKKDINSKIQYDLFASAVQGKTVRKFFCEEALKKEPQSVTWSLRICRYLLSWKEGTKSKETLDSIRDQLKEESVQRMYYLEVLNKL